MPGAAVGTVDSTDELPVGSILGFATGCALRLAMGYRLGETGKALGGVEKGLKDGFTVGCADRSVGLVGCKDDTPKGPDDGCIDGPAYGGA